MQIALVIIFGLLIGSFINVCIYRIPLNRSVVSGRSYCPRCGALIRWFENIPVLSYLILRGRCHVCKEKISFIYPLIEISNALLYLSLFWIYGLSLQWFFYAFLFSILLVITVIDWQKQIIPDGLVLAILISGIIFTLIQIVTDQIIWYQPLFGFIAASLPLFILGLIYEGGMGGGDIKMMAAAGLFIGWKMILLALFLASLIGCFTALYILFRGKGHLKSTIAFGPFLSMGIYLSILLGERLIDWYLLLIF